jgi:hypothetical protein
VRLAWLIVPAVVILASAAFVVLTKTRPGYDAFGWLVWGRQVLHWNLNTDGAPSWKPVTFLFTLPYALAGRAQPWLWVITAVAVAFSGAVFAGRIAYRLTGPCPQRRYAPIVAAAVAGIGVLGLNGYAQLLLIANSDPMIVTFCLAAIDSHLSGRRKLAFAMLVLAALGRPEAWAFAGLYALWAWRALPSMRLLAVVGLALIPALWFSIPALTSKSWFISGDLALNAHTMIHGSKIIGVISRLRSLSGLPMQLAAVFAVALALARRDRTSLMLAGAAVLWVAIEIAFAWHGWSAVPRYLIEPAAVMVVLAGGAVGRVLAYTPRHATMLRWAGPVAVLALIVSLTPYARDDVRITHAQIIKQASDATRLSRLQSVIAREGGAARILACGQPVTFVGFQSTLAWELGMNVGNVGYKPGRSIDLGTPIVVFRPQPLGWSVTPYHMRPADAASCDRLRTDITFG